MTQSLQETSH